MAKSELTAEMLHDLRKQYESAPESSILERAVTQNGINNVAKDKDIKTKLNPVFSVEVETGNVSNQKRSGRCWLFSILNTLKHRFAKKYNVKNFELSQNYLFFWDKIERANIFYDRMIATAGLPTNDRTVSFYLDGPGTDGGQWAMAASLVQKYGVMPTSAFSETNVSENTTDLNEVLNLKLRRDGMKLREMVNNDATDEDINAAREKMLSEVYRIAGYSLGVPPKTFDFEYRDDKKKYHLDCNLTPKSFYAKYFSDVDLNDYVVLSNSPDKAMNKRYSMSAQNNVVGGINIEFLNLTMPELKTAAIEQLKAGETVWFGNDVTRQLSRKEGLLDANLYHYDELFNLNLSMTKAERLAYKQGEVSHAMTLTGVDLVNDKPTKWKVENSWGDKNGFNGYFVMADNWMDEYVYEVVINKKFLTDSQRELLSLAPEELKPWDSLA
ncbi:C1 family peptidase [Apilactobacillus xinyiensis]|uniref:C1 family peptidase n=1 Tax=Apilactobacillus xinyiensis TaxID=2841032 RepID=UPI0024B19746|nr:C1 family peptidase [Apilactobacillus xinyiensis]